MKKTILIITALLAIACNKEPRMQEVTFRASLVEEKAITRAVNHTDVVDYILSLYPTSIKPLLKPDGQVEGERTVTLDTPTLMDIGEYEVYYESYPNSVEKIGGSLNITDAPSLAIREWIEIIPGITEYTLPVRIESYAFIIDPTEVSRIDYMAADNTWHQLPMDNQYGYSIAFLTGAFGRTQVFKIRVSPTSAAYESEQFLFAPELDSYNGEDVYHISYGHYYIVHPKAVTDVTSSFSIVIPSWECGME